jgi:hypothetical protein
VTLRLAAPAIFVASLLLLPFLNKPFTIDDPLFLRAAKHALVDPLHPADFEQVWNVGDRQKLSQYLLGGTLPAYVLSPVAALGGREWMAHLYQVLLLSGFLLASVSVARRLGCDRRQASTVGLVIASNPVTLAMAATCMPNVMAIMFGMLGMDRILLFREARRWGVGLASGLLLAAAVLCRASTAPLVLVAVLLRLLRGGVANVDLPAGNVKLALIQGNALGWCGWRRCASLASNPLAVRWLSAARGVFGSMTTKLARARFETLLLETHPKPTKAPRIK